MSQSLARKVTTKLPTSVLYYASYISVMKGLQTNGEFIKDKGISSDTEYVEIRIPVEFIEHAFKGV